MADLSRSTRKFVAGERVELDVTGIAHGGECVARLDGWVFFLKYAIPGERVVAEITQIGKSFHRADAVEILVPSPDRITSPCSYFHPGGCGGCDFLHIDLARQRALKAEVMREQFIRVAKMELSIPVTEVELPSGSGFRYRNRLTLHIDHAGRAGFHKSRSHEIQLIDDCLVVSEKAKISEVLSKNYPGITKIEIPNHERIEEIEIGGKLYQYRVSPKSFWQGHVRAAQVLGEAMLTSLEPKVGEHALDLYGGVGLFAKVLATHGVHVDVIESNESAVADGEFNLRDFPDSRFHLGDVAKKIRNIASADIVVLDPPRTGAEEIVLNHISKLAPRRICYISCDPATLARDTQRLAALGYQIRSTAAFDLFPQTAHIECVLTFEPVIS